MRELKELLSDYFLLFGLMKHDVGVQKFQLTALSYLIKIPLINKDICSECIFNPVETLESNLQSFHKQPGSGLQSCLFFHSFQSCKALSSCLWV